MSVLSEICIEGGQLRFNERECAFHAGTKRGICNAMTCSTWLKHFQLRRCAPCSSLWGCVVGSFSEFRFPLLEIWSVLFQRNLDWPASQGLTATLDWEIANVEPRNIDENTRLHGLVLSAVILQLLPVALGSPQIESPGVLQFNANAGCPPFQISTSGMTSVRRASQVTV
jgi:hypothetical protein